MKKLLSYIWPFTKNVNSDYSGQLEVTLINGNKVLDSKNANYSYGTLQRILEAGIAKIDLKNTDSILLLGLGGGSVVTSLRNRFRFTGKIHAIEIDQKVISIAQEEFGIKAGNHLTIEHRDAFEYVENEKALFNVIIVDLFLDNRVPSKFYTNGFCKHVANRLKDGGTILFNLGINQLNTNEREQVVEYFKTENGFHCTLLERVEETNTLALIKKHLPSK